MRDNGAVYIKPHVLLLVLTDDHAVEEPIAAFYNQDDAKEYVSSRRDSNVDHPETVYEVLTIDLIGTPNDL